MEAGMSTREDRRKTTSVRLNPGERREIEAAARLAGMESMAAFLRWAALHEARLWIQAALEAGQRETDVE
jgi:uncharacterized protein (DUF1778 family)